MIDLRPHIDIDRRGNPQDHKQYKIYVLEEFVGIVGTKPGSGISLVRQVSAAEQKLIQVEVRRKHGTEEFAEVHKPQSLRDAESKE